MDILVRDGRLWSVVLRIAQDSSVATEVPVFIQPERCCIFLKIRCFLITSGPTGAKRIRRDRAAQGGTKLVRVLGSGFKPQPVSPIRLEPIYS